MANYYASSRTSYVKVKNEKQFVLWAEKVAGRIITKEDEEHGTLFGLLFDEDDSGMIPEHIWDDEVNDLVEYSICEELQPHISEGWAIVLMEVGAEKFRYLVGQAIIVTPKTIRSINLSSWVTETMKELGNPTYTKAEY